MKKKAVIVVLTAMLVGIGGYGVTNARANTANGTSTQGIDTDTEETSVDTETKAVTYESAYYLARIPAGWTVVDHGNGKLTFSKDIQEICTIEVSDGWSDCTSTSKIIEDYFGMHASVSGEVEEDEVNGWKRAKAVISIEQSAAEQEKAKQESAQTDELHYIYTDAKDTILDVRISNETHQDTELETFLDSIALPEME